jgi:DNA-binding transcriptional ArsR family regulator
MYLEGRSNERKADGLSGAASDFGSSSPLRPRLLQLLEVVSYASAKEIAATFSEPRSSVGEQLRRLSEEGLIRVVGVKQRRGAVERFYACADLGPRGDSEGSGPHARGNRRRHLRTFILSLRSALAGGESETHSDSRVSSTSLAVDLDGWRELHSIHRRTLLEVERVRIESAARLRGADHRRITASSSLFLLKLPGP